MDAATADPIIDIVSRLRGTHADRLEVKPTETWWYFTPRRSPALPAQGWKLHVSATPTHAPAVLETVSQLLIDRDAAWKVCRDLRTLRDLCSVPSPLPQVGKFVTVYPRTDAESVALATELHARTRHFEGPRVPSDRRFSPRSIVSYRYGGYQSIDRFDADGLRVPCILTPDGTPVPDLREPGRWRPDWAVDPFPAQPQASRPAGGLFGRGLVVRGVLRQSTKGGVYAVTRGVEHLVLKEARFGTNPDELGRDARDRLTNEFEILTALSPLGIGPQPFEIFDVEDNRYLLMQHLVGISLRSYLEGIDRLGPERGRQTRPIAQSIIQLVERCHSAGVILRDLSPNNILVSGGECKLVDLELAHRVGTSQPPFHGATPGYVPPGAEAADRTTTDFDHYALGGTLFFLSTGLDPHLGPDQDIRATGPRLLSSLRRPSVPRAVARAAAAYMRWPSPAEVVRDAGADCAGIVSRASATADHLYATANWEDTRRLWPGAGDMRFPGCVFDGSAGIAQFLCEVAEISHDPRYSTYARRVIDWTLEQHPYVPGETPRGLYFGYGGVAWLLGMLGDARAIHMARELAQPPFDRIDVTHGAAGLGLLCLELHERSGDPELLTLLENLAEYVAARAERGRHGIVTWPDRGRSLGFAHGVAGVTYFLLGAALRTGSTRLLSLARDAGEGLLRAATPMIGGRGLSWTKELNSSDVPWSHWCNGAAGVGYTLVALARLFGDRFSAAAAARAATAVRMTEYFHTCSQCHGLAGDGEYLLHFGRELDNSVAMDGARRIATRLAVLQLQEPPAWTWPVEGEGKPVPAYMLGYTGVHSFLLRLTHPDLRLPFMPRLEAGLR
jgi:hypothetical protein